MTDARDQVLMTRFSPFRFISSTFFESLSDTNGPFFSDLDILRASSLRSLPSTTSHPVLAYRFLARRRTMYLSVRLLWRVL